MFRDIKRGRPLLRPIGSPRERGRPLLRRGRQAQSLIEYSMVIGIVVAILVAMQPLIKRSTQGMIKLVADQIGIQNQSDQPFDSSSYLNITYSTTRTTLFEERTEHNTMANYIYSDISVTHSTQVMNLGVSE